jgi:hypothetical protein
MPEEETAIAMSLFERVKSNKALHINVFPVPC